MRSRRQSGEGGGTGATRKRRRQMMTGNRTLSMYHSTSKMSYLKGWPEKK